MNTQDGDNWLMQYPNFPAVNVVFYPQDLAGAKVL